MRKFIHVKSPEYNTYPMYSVEFRSRRSTLPAGWPNAWSQFALTNNKRKAILWGIEARLQHPMSEHRTRVL